MPLKSHRTGQTESEVSLTCHRKTTNSTGSSWIVGMTAEARKDPLPASRSVQNPRGHVLRTVVHLVMSAKRLRGIGPEQEDKALNGSFVS
jgi:hypothetical protein